MEQLFQFLNKNSGALTVVFSAVVTLSTVVYAILTAVLVNETKKMRKVQTEPKIQIIVENLESAVNIARLQIKNIGLAPAEDLKFEYSVITGGQSAQKLLEEFTQSNFFSTGIRYFGPGQIVNSHYTLLNHDYKGKTASVLIFKLSYRSIAGKTYRDEIIIDMSELKGRYQIGKPNLYSIAQSLEKLQKDFNNVATGFKKLKIETYSKKDRDLEMKMILKNLGKIQPKRAKQK